MTQQPAAEQPAMITDRYEIQAEDGGTLTLADRQPWTRCWSCNATENSPGELFCTECGAALDGRSYRGVVTPDTATGIALVPEITSVTARAVLPQVWDRVAHGDATVTILPTTQPAALTLPLAEADALALGRGLARLLAELHGAGMVLGPVDPRLVALSGDRAPLLHDVPGLRRVTADDSEARPADLLALAALLATVTQTPHITRRLSEDAPLPPAEPDPFADLLRDVRTGTVADAAALAARIDALIAERAAPLALRTRVGAASHTGMVRELDEDSLLYTELRINRKAATRAWGVYIVADGMGGHSAGEVASDLALRGAYETVMRAYMMPTVDVDDDDDLDRLRETVRAAIHQANAYVINAARARNSDMGTTLTMALVAGNRAVIGNVGDSRTYLIRDGALRRISRDHSLVQRLVEIGQITDDDIYTHPQRNAVLRSLGDRAELDVDVFVERLRPGDALLLMSDGQWEMTRDPQMLEIIAAHEDPQAACEALIVAANAAGGDDNITVILAKFEAEAGS